MMLYERAGGLKGTVLDLGSMILRDPTALFIVAVNIGAVAFVLFHPPYTHSLFFIMWCDCILIGLFGILKLFFIPIRLGPEADAHPRVAFILRMLGRGFVAAFFAFAYGFLLVCVTALLGGLAGEEMRIRKWYNFDEKTFFLGLWIPVALLLAGHALSFLWNFLIKKEYQSRTLEDQMARPFGRAMFILFTLMIGGILVSTFRLPVLLPIVFLPMKIAGDLLGHFLDHR